MLIYFLGKRKEYLECNLASLNVITVHETYVLELSNF